MALNQSRHHPDGKGQRDQHRLIICAAKRRLLLAVDSYQSTSQFVFEELNVGVNHERNQFGKENLWLPPKHSLSLGRIAAQVIYFRGPIVAWIELNILVPVKSDAFK